MNMNKKNAVSAVWNPFLLAVTVLLLVVGTSVLSCGRNASGHFRTPEDAAQAFVDAVTNPQSHLALNRVLDKSCIISIHYHDPAQLREYDKQDYLRAKVAGASCSRSGKEKLCKAVDLSGA